MNAGTAIGDHAAMNSKQVLENLESLGSAQTRKTYAVEVDHGDTSCKTPSTVPYTRKVAAHAREKAAKKAMKTQGIEASGNAVSMRELAKFGFYG